MLRYPRRGGIFSTACYGATRKKIAASLGVPVRYLDSECDKEAKRRRTAGNGASSEERPRICPPPPPPAASPRSLAHLLDTIVKVIKHRVVMPAGAVDVVALWAAACWGYEKADIFPRLLVSSPAPRCGKSTLLDTVAVFVPRAMRADGITASAMFRVIERERPTLLLDEADTYLAKNEELRGVINSGHANSGYVVRNVPQQDGGYEPARFSTFSPVALAGIGRVPATVNDRSIRVGLQRAEARAGKAKRIRQGHLDKLRDRFGPHLAAHAGAIAAAIDAKKAAVPPSLNGRDADNWEPLVAVADLAGGSWPGRAAAAAVALCGDGATRMSRGEQMLADVRAVFLARRREAAEKLREWRRKGRRGPRPSGGDRMSCEEIVTELNKMDSRPWPGENGGKGLATHNLGRTLAVFGVQSRNVRVNSPLGSNVVRGHYFADLRPMFRRYLGP